MSPCGNKAYCLACIPVPSHDVFKLLERAEEMLRLAGTLRRSGLSSRILSASQPEEGKRQIAHTFLTS